MPLLQCPYCESTDICVIESPRQLPSSQTLTTPIAPSMMSPPTLIALGVSVSKSLNIPPIAGALVGVVVSGIWMLLVDDEQKAQTKQHIIYQQECYCKDCDRSFSPNMCN
ncbi:hypothetical protein [Acinetobacter sp. HR7]|uniref:hypothetical protein n=1 Tax=Acinetobacter sp. HR7 TaxID=1509403 RepID=UPI000538517C|nr:hypothetical protein [Acinetobacter sp. HR7]KGT46400.1 hypothetical protein GW12_25590 [Acinetobacter sp. HR7]